MLVVVEEEKLENLDGNPWSKARTITKSTIYGTGLELNLQIDGRQVLSPLCHSRSPNSHWLAVILQINTTPFAPIAWTAFPAMATNPTEGSTDYNNMLLQTTLQSIYLLCCFLFVSLLLFSFPPFFFLFSPLFLLLLLPASFLFFLLFKLLLFFTFFLFPILSDF